MTPESGVVSIRAGALNWAAEPETLAAPRRALAGRCAARTCAFGTSRTAQPHPHRRSSMGHVIGLPTPFASAPAHGMDFHRRQRWPRLLRRAAFAENCWADGGR